MRRGPEECRALAAAGAAAMLLLAVVAAATWGGEPQGKGGSRPPDITFPEDEDGESTSGRSPFGSGPAGVSRKGGVPGLIEVSTGLKVPGTVYTTRAKRLKIYNLKRSVYEYVPVPALDRVEAVVEWERLDKEWRFKEAGNPEKVYTGRSYPVRMLCWRLVLRNGHEIVGHILGQPLYVEHNGKAERFILHQRDKGPMGGTLDGLIYIRRVELGPEAYNRAVAELKAKAEAAETRN